jgi:hypothetical protein
MADFSTAATQALNTLNAGSPVEEYETTIRGRRVKRGKPLEQVEAAIRLSALSARCTSGLFRVAKFRNPRT